MNDHDKHEVILKQLDDLRVESVTLRIASRRSVRAVGPAGDEFRTSESEVSWTITQPNPSVGPMTPELAHAAALKFSPILIRKVIFDLVVAGVLRKEDAEKRLEFANTSYANALKGKRKDGPDNQTTGQTSSGEDSSDIRRVGDPLSASGEEPTEGSAISQGQDIGVSNQDGPSDGSSASSTPRTLSDSDYGPKP